MPSTLTGGHDGPYPAPIEIGGFTVDPAWIDYNGHMNVGYYGVVFDMAFDVLLTEYLGLGEAHVQATSQGPYILQSHLMFLREITQGEEFCFRIRLLDADHKRGHYFSQMISAAEGSVCATQEAVFMNVSHVTGRSAPYPDWAAVRLAQMVRDHELLKPVPQIGQPIGIRR